jgi:uncharacterized protein with FMN-binding domain
MSAQKIIASFGVIILAAAIIGGVKAQNFPRGEDNREILIRLNSATPTNETTWTNLFDPWQGSDLPNGVQAVTNTTGATTLVEAANSDIPTDTAKPALTITTPTDGASFDTETTTTTVEIAASDDSGWVEVVVQNLDATGKTRETYAVKNGSVPNFQLHTGWNTILALARDKAGNVATHFILVERTIATISTALHTPDPATESEPAAEVRGLYHDGTYTGTGYYGWGENKFPLTIKITIEQGYLRKLEYLEFPTSDLVKDESFLDPMKNALLAKQDISAVNTISGATGTSNAFLDAVNSALVGAR